MKVLVLFLCVLFFSSNLFSQVFEWADIVFLAGRTEEAADNEIYTATDLEGNIFVTGKFKQEVIISSKYVKEKTGEKYTSQASVVSKGGNDIFLAKYDVDGVLEWVHSFGGSGDDIGKAVAVNSEGDIALTGQFEGMVDFAGIQVSSSRKNNAFLAVFDKTGKVKWVQRAGGISKQPAVETGSGIAFDAANNIYLTGAFYGNDDSGNYSIPGKATFGDYQVTNATQSTNSFVAKYSKEGKIFWVQVVSHYGQGGSMGICVDGAGNSYITGVCSATFVFGGQALNSMGLTDVYVAKFSNDGTPIWLKQFGSGEKFNPVNVAKYTDPFETGTGICIDSKGFLFVSGQFCDEMQIGSTKLESNGFADIFLMKMTPDGGVVWAKQTGGEYLDFSKSVCLDNKGSVYICGSNSEYGGLDREAIGNWTYTTARGLGFIEKYSAEEGDKKWGANAGSFGLHMAVDLKAQLYLVGSFANQVKFDDIKLDIKGKLKNVETTYEGWLVKNAKTQMETYESGFGLYMVKIKE